MATINIDLIKKGQLGQFDKYLETNSFVDGVVVSKKDQEIYNLINNGFDQKKNKHVARWYNYYRQLAPSVLAALPEDGQVVLTASSSSASSSSSSASGSSSSGSSSSDSDSSEDEATKKAKAKAARQQGKIDAEQSTLVIDVNIRYENPDLDAIAAQIRQIERKSLLWAPTHEAVSKGYGRFTLRMGCTITNIFVDTDDLLGEIEELNDEEQFSAQIIAFNKI